MNFNWWTFALQAVNFLILVWLLQRFLFKPVRTMVARRQEEIAHALTEASAEKASTQQLRAQLEASKSEMSAARQKMIDEARAMLSEERRKSLEEAQRETDKLSDQARQRLEEERINASAKLYEQTVELATKLAERMLREVGLGSVEQAFFARVVDYLDRMVPEERVKLLSRNGSGEVLVTTAHPLDSCEQGRWREALAKRLGAVLAVTFRTDATLIGGMVLTFPHAMLNFNWRDSLAVALKEFHADEHAR